MNNQFKNNDMELAKIKTDLDNLLDGLHKEIEFISSDNQEINLEYDTFTICFSLESTKLFGDSTKKVIIYNAFIQHEDFETILEQHYLTQIQNYLNE